MTEARLPAFRDVQAATRRLQGHVVRTPLLESEALNERAGARVLLKPESLQRTGSFKIRGAYNRLAQLSDAERTAGVVAFSSGNHAQGVALAARELGVHAAIVMPANAPRTKIARTRRLGAEVVLYDPETHTREALATALAQERGATLVPSFDDPAIIAGQGTVGLEMVEDAQRAGLALDAVLVPCGGGGLVSGTALSFEALSPHTRLYAVEPEQFDDTRRSLAGGERLAVMMPAASICDALLTPMPGKLTFAINRRLLAGAVTVSDADVLAAQAFAFAELKLVVEPGGAVALAALLGGAPDGEFKTLGVVLSGGNVDAETFGKALS